MERLLIYKHLIVHLEIWLVTVQLYTFVEGLLFMLLPYVLLRTKMIEWVSYLHVFWILRLVKYTQWSLNVCLSCSGSCLHRRNLTVNYMFSLMSVRFLFLHLHQRMNWKVFTSLWFRMARRELLHRCKRIFVIFFFMVEVIHQVTAYHVVIAMSLSQRPAL